MGSYHSYSSHSSYPPTSIDPRSKGDSRTYSFGRTMAVMAGWVKYLRAMA
ncbi:hypothetical protein CfE428DRAFT_0349 [Chthoniobacter flavus Ellin428]|uniref:Uncharacterized protein n=1 Tax=Chthoniobacter flavus Ellin428 TaxID=497964 RepID=B4CUI6_9BACT|nr:hypothetical protein CfE428DRAFT_0349 [Chthoniobacter flavus Ellin428]TCO94750.1 hypothetical protein EV701_102219 [Chthoniobacter flavus]